MAHHKLLTELQDLKAGYVSVLNDLEVMKNWGRVHLHALFATQIGKYEIDIMELRIELKAVRRKIQMAHQAINQGNYPDFEHIEITVQQLMGEAYAEITTAKNILTERKTLLSNLVSTEETTELRKIFRNIAKALHPDINPALTQEHQEIWHQFHAAYKNGDLEQFKALEIVYADLVAAVAKEPEELSEDEILRQCSTLKNGIQELVKQKKELEEEFPFSLAEELHDEDWLAEKQQALQRDVAEYKAALEEKKADYELIKETYER